MSARRVAQVVEVSTSKTGKHGHAKCHFVALDIFTNRKMEELVPSSHNLEVGQPARRCRRSVLSGCAVAHSRLAARRGRRAGWQSALASQRATAGSLQHNCNRCATRSPLASLQVPHVSRQDYSLLDISDDGFVRCLLARLLWLSSR